MKKILTMCAVALFTLTGCYEQPPQNKTEQARKAADAANSIDRKSTRLNSSHSQQSRMPSSA